MNNMSMSSMMKMGPTGGETFTVTCFACGMPSSKEWAQRVRSRPFGGYQEPFYPLLEMHPPPPGAIVMEDGSTYLCAFCNALLESQWNAFQTRGDTGSPMDRKYIIHKFICAVCGVETYRKRVRALPFQEFPFLMKGRQPGSITLGNNPLAVVCLDCSETLWAQSAEYDRWGLPVQKRHFNWMARPPPPEDSVEATVARLPSGETQLPRCPPTDPLVPPRTNEPTALPEAIQPIRTSRPRTSSNSFQHHHLPRQHQHPDGGYLANSPSPGTTPPRKSSVTRGMTPPSDAGSPLAGQPPIVTVAPMSSQHTPTYSRKNSMSFPPSGSSSGSSSSQGKYDSAGTSTTQTRQQTTHHGATAGTSSSSFSHLQQQQQQQLFHQSSLFSSPLAFPSPGPYPWPSLGMEGHSSADISRLSSPYAATFGSEHPTAGVPHWPWLSHGSPELLRYHQSYLASLQSRGLTDPYFQSPSSIIYPPSSSATTYLSHFQGQQQQQSSASIRVITPPSSLVTRSSTSSPSSYNDRSSTSASHRDSIQSQISHHHHHHHEAEAEATRNRSTGSTRSPTPPHHQQQQQHQQRVQSEHRVEHRVEHKQKSEKSQHVSSGEESKTQKSHSSAKSHTKTDSQTTVVKGRENESKRASPTKSNKSDSSSPEHRLHWKSKKSGLRKTSSTSASKSDSVSTGGNGATKEKHRRSEVLLPKKRHWQPPATTSSSTDATAPSTSTSNLSGHKSVLEKKRKFSTGALTSSGGVVDFTARRKGSIPSDAMLLPSTVESTGAKTSNESDAMDLSLPPTTLTHQTHHTSSPTSSENSRPRKFSIAYLSQSESAPPQENVDQQSELVNEEENRPEISPVNERSSVIVTATASTNSELVVENAPVVKEDTKPEDSETCKETDKEKDANAATSERSPSPELENPATEEQLPDETEPDLKESENVQDVQETTPTTIKSECETSTASEEQKQSPEEGSESHDESKEKEKMDETKDADVNNEANNDSPKKAENKEAEIELQVQYVTVGDIRMNPDDFVRKSIDDFIISERKLAKVQKEEFNERWRFLRQLGLITPDMKAELELKTLARRDEKNTIAPLKLRVKTPPPFELNIDETLEQQLLEVAFDDPSLKQNKCDPILSSFLQNLGLKPCTKLEKSRREIKWRHLLKDRLLRTKNNLNFRCIQRPWTNYNRISKLFSPKRRNTISTTNPSDIASSDPLTFLTLTLPPEVEEMDVNSNRRNSFDLLTTVETNNSDADWNISNDVSQTGKSPSRICIKYPKYIPSYALEVKIESSANETFSQEDNGTISEDIQQHSQLLVKVPDQSIKMDAILKIPVVTPSSALVNRRRSSDSTLKSTISDEDLLDDDDFLLNGEVPSNWSELENILKASTAQWEKTKKVMEDALNETDYLKSKENHKLLGEQAARLRAIRKHLKSQQTDMKETEKLFKGKEKQIMKKLQNLTKYSKNSSTKKSKETKVNVQQSSGNSNSDGQQTSKAKQSSPKE